MNIKLSPSMYYAMYYESVRRIASRIANGFSCADSCAFFPSEQVYSNMSGCEPPENAHKFANSKALLPR
jgi:hypothetical protein